MYWTVYGKIARIKKHDGTVIAYSYDASGNRISKSVHPASGIADTTVYVRDASGNTMSIYEKSDSLRQTEVDIYGSSRLGVVNTTTNMQRNHSVDSITLEGDFGAAVLDSFTRGVTFLELTNHLQNVMVVVTDRKLPVADTSGDGYVSRYNADIASATDYYPGGMIEPGRDTSFGNYYTYWAPASAGAGSLAQASACAQSQYRYGFNGQEKSNEIANDTYTAEFWEYDSRIAKRWNVDPMTQNFPNLSPYSVFNGNPIKNTDPTGDSSEDVHITGPDRQQAFQELQSSVGGYLNLSMDNSGNISYSPVVLPTGQTVAPNEAAQRVMLAVDDHSINVNVNATGSNINSAGHLFVGGAFMGNTVTPASDNNFDINSLNPLIAPSTATSTVQVPMQAVNSACGYTVQTQQEVNPGVLGAMDNYYQKPGASILHEVTESYLGGAMSQASGTSSPAAGQPGSVYQAAHNSAAPQPGPVYQHVYNSQGSEVYPDATGAYPGAAQINYDVQQGNKPAQTIETYP